MARIVSGPYVSGRVVAKQTGTPISGVTVTVSPAAYTTVEMTSQTTSLTTNGDGVFVCYALPGTYTFTTTAVDAAPIEPVEILGSEGLGADRTSSGASLLTLGPSTGTDDSTAWQAALTAARTAGGGYVRGLPGETYYLSATALIGSHTTLDMTGCKVRLKAGVVQVSMLRNYAHNNATTVMDGAVTTGTAALACATSLPFTGAYAAVGTPVLVWGAGPKGQNLSTTISAVTDSGHVTLADNASTTISGATVSVGTRDVNIKVIGGEWDRNGVISPDCPTGDIMRFRRVDGLTVEDTKFPTTTGFHCINPADATNVSILRPHGALPSQTDLVHLNGPMDGFSVMDARGWGSSALVSVCPNDYASVGSTDTYGWITNGEIAGVHAEAPNTGLLVGLLGGNSLTGLANVTSRDIKGYSIGSQGLVLVGDDNSDAGTHGGVLDNITVEAVTGPIVTTSALALVSCNPANGKRIKFRGIGLDTAHQGTWLPAAYINVPSAATITSLTAAETAIGTFTGSGPSIVTVSGTVNNLILPGITGKDLLYAIDVTATGVVNRAVVANAAMDGRFSIARTAVGAILTTVEASNITSNGSGHALGDYAGTTELHLVNVTVPSAATDLINLGAAAAVTVYGANCNFNGKQPVGTAGGTFRSKSFGVPVDVSNSFVALNAGDLAYNTNSAVAGGVGPAICDGTNWRSQAANPKAAMLTPAKANRYIYAAPGCTPSTAGLTANQMRYAPVFFDRVTTVIALGVNVTTGAASSVGRLGLYADNAGQPTGTPVIDTGTAAGASAATVDGSTTGYKEITFTGVAVSPGLYWVAVAGQGATFTVTAGAGVTTGVAAPGGYSGSDVTGWVDSGSVSAALPSANPSSVGRGPLVSVKVSG